MPKLYPHIDPTTDAEFHNVYREIGLASVDEASLTLINNPVEPPAPQPDPIIGPMHLTFPLTFRYTSHDTLARSHHWTMGVIDGQFSLHAVHLYVMNRPSGFGKLARRIFHIELQGAGTDPATGQTMPNTINVAEWKLEDSTVELNRLDNWSWENPWDNGDSLVGYPLNYTNKCAVRVGFHWQFDPDFDMDREYTYQATVSLIVLPAPQSLVGPELIGV